MRRLLLLALLPALALAQDRQPPVPQPAPPARKGPLVTLEVVFSTHVDAAPAAKASVDALDEKALAAMRPNMTRITAPRLTVFDDQEATVTVVNQHAFVRARDKAGNALIDTVQSGVVLLARPKIDGKTVRVALTLTQSELAEPMAKLQTPRGDIELPLLTKEELRATLDVASGGAVSLRVRKPGRKESMIVTLRATVVKLAAIKKPN